MTLDKRYTGLIAIFKSVITQKMTDLKMNIDVVNLTKGMYVLEYTDGENKTATRFLKQ
ncbi:MAG: hypothetical protein ACI9XO_000308 [Paraglaciecola sp.]|jgi:hypothetical protein